MPKRHRIDQRALDELLQRDDHVVTHAELKSLGMPASTVAYRSRPDGPWQRLLPGVVVTHSGPVTRHQQLVGAVKYAGADAVVAGAAALELHGMRSVPRGGDVALLVPHRRRRQSHDYVVIERTRRPPRTSTRSGIPCVQVARGVVGACQRIKRRDLIREIVAEAVQSRRCRVRDLLDEIRAAQRRGSALPRRVLREIAAGIRSVAEAKAREIMMERGTPLPRWNPDLEDSSGQFIISPDGYWEDVAVALELDSMEWHLSPRGYKRTQRRQQLMGRHGIIVIPIAPGDVIDDPDGFVATIEATIRNAQGRILPDVRVRVREAAEAGTLVAESSRA